MKAEAIGQLSLGQPEGVPNGAKVIHEQDEYAYRNINASGICLEELEPGGAVDYAHRMSGQSQLAANVSALRRHLGLKQTAFAELVDSDQANVSKWERGTEPKAHALERLAQLAGTTIADFSSKPWKPATPSPRSDHQPTRTADGGETTGIVQLDLSLAMGPGTVIEDFVESEPVQFDIGVLRKITRTPFDRLRLVTGIGESHEPKFHNNDQFLIDINERQLTRLDGYYWITVHGAHALKRLRPAGKDRIEILSENPSYGPQVEDRADVRIEGRAIWMSRGI